MPTLTVEPWGREDWRRVTERFANLSLPQTWAYGEAKARTGPWRVERGLFQDGTRTIGAVQVLLRPLPGGMPGGLAWISRGPLWQSDSETDDGRLAPLLAALRRNYVDQRGLYLRIAPSLAADSLAAATGFAATGTAGWASARLDLRGSVETLRGGLQQKWRNVLNKAERSAMTVERETAEAGSERFAAFLEDYRGFLADRRIATTVTPDLLRALAAGGDGALDLLAATDGGQVLGWTLIARAGATAEYLAGVVGDEGRRRGAGQCLLWQAVLGAKAQGCAVFDLGGLDPDLTPEGIRHFKEGLGGVPYRLTDEIEAVPGGLLRGALGRLVRWRVGQARTAA